MITMADELVAQKALIFGKYDTSDVIVNDGGLAKYIDLTPTNVPHSGGKHANRWFGKSRLSIVERLINNIMRTEKYTGKKMKAYKTVAQAFDIVAAKTKKNPVQVLVECLEGGGHQAPVRRNLRSQGRRCGSPEEAGYRSSQSEHRRRCRFSEEQETHL